MGKCAIKCCPNDSQKRNKNHGVHFHRTCLSRLRPSSEECTDIFATELHWKDDMPPLHCYLMIAECTALPVYQGDDLPVTICTDCLRTLQVAFSFKKSCENSYLSLLGLLADSKDRAMPLEIKIEQEVDDDNTVKFDEVSLKEEPEQDSDSDEKYKKHKKKKKKTIAKRKGVELTPTDYDLTGIKDIPPEDITEENAVTVIRKYSSSYLSRNGTVTYLKRARRRFYCHICKRVVVHRLKHLQTHGMALDKSLKCDKCKAVYFDKVKYDIHIKNHGKALTCPECGEKFKTVRLLNIHSETHESFTCDSCGKVCSTMTALKRHKETAHENTEVSCPECGKILKNPGRLKVHLAIHSDVKKYVCEYCSKAFRFKKTMECHISYIHSNERSHSCLHCDKKFKSATALKIHNRRHLGIKAFKCKICDQSFVTSGALSSHMFKHTKEKKHPCRVCGVKFSRTDHRSRHERTAHGFSHKDNLKNCLSEDLPSIFS